MFVLVLQNYDTKFYNHRHFDLNTQTKKIKKNGNGDVVVLKSLPKPVAVGLAS